MSTEDAVTCHLVLLSPRASAEQFSAAVERAEAALLDAGAACSEPVRRTRGSTAVADLAVQGLGVEQVREAITGVDLGAESAQESDAPVDAVVVPASLRGPGRVLLVMDVDSTYIQDEVIELIADHAGRRAEVAAATAAAMRGEVDFATSLRSRVAELVGVPVAALHEVRAQVRFTPGSRELARAMRASGHEVLLVSGGFTEVVSHLAAAGQITRFVANRLDVADGALTGKVDGRIVDRAIKEATLRDVAAEEGISLERVIAVGDGANDLDMMSAAALGVAFNAKPVVQQHADAAINVPDLDVVLDLLGIDTPTPRL